MENIVCLDRDGTINEDENYYLGRDSQWIDKVKIIDGVAEGIKRLNRLRSTHVFIVTNQSGVALVGSEFDNLTEKRLDEVNRYIIDLLKNRGARIDGCFACPYVDEAYAMRARDAGRMVDIRYVHDGHRDIKPDIGMLEKCAESLDLSLKEVNLFVIGDRKSDVELGLNGGGRGILVASKKTVELGDDRKVRELEEKHPGRVYVAENFLDAARYVESIIS